MKKIATLAASAALLGAAILPALATGNNCENTTTGPFSTNNCVINNSSNVSVTNYQDAVIINKVTSRSNTGNNSADYNTLGGSIYTGNATNNTVVSSVANIATTNITGGPAMSNNWGSNNVTGPFSGNEVYLNNRLRVDVDNQNTAFVKNDVDATSSTGDNSASTNTGPGVIRTGDSWLGLSVGTHANDVLTNIEAGAGGSGGNNGWNGTTGPFSTNNVVINNDAAARVRTYQDLVVKNYVDAFANTGNNSADTNTLGGDILTGDANAGVGVNTEGNISTTLVSMALGAFGNAGGTLVSGPYSDNQVYLNNNQDIQVDNQNNKCRSHNADTLPELLHERRWGDEWNTVLDGIEKKRKCNPADLGVRNDIDSYVNTGDNSASTGTGPGYIVDGWANLVESVVTHFNDVLTNIGH